jgi:hypothetical protein
LLQAYALEKEEFGLKEYGSKSIGVTRRCTYRNIGSLVTHKVSRIRNYIGTLGCKPNVI